MSNGNVRRMINQLDMRWRRRVPVIHQTETSECGLACLAMIRAVSYTHLTLPTIYTVEISVGAVSLKKKTHKSAAGA